MKKSNSFEHVACKLAYNVSKQEVNSACPWIFYQPKLPKSLKKLKEK